MTPSKFDGCSFTRADAPPGGRCLIVENGVACDSDAKSRGMCPRHAAALRELGRYEELARPKRSRRGSSRYATCALARNPAPPPGICVIVENDAACTSPATARGVCVRHGNALRTVGRFDELALPPRLERDELRPYRDAPEGACRVLVGDRPCPAPARGAYGLCAKHYARIHQAHRLGTMPAVEVFARAHRAITYSRQQGPEPGRCVVCSHLPGESDRPCHATAWRRGLCRPHHRQLVKEPALLERIANPSLVPRASPRGTARGDAESEYASQPNPQPGGCYLVENGVACDRRESRRGLCSRHVQALRRIGRFEEFALPAHRSATHDLRPYPGAPDGACRVLVNGVPCSQRARGGQLGLCRRHYGALWQRSQREGADVLAPWAPSSDPIALTRKDRPQDGVCVVSDCSASEHVRGLCRPHYRKLERLGRAEFDRIANPARGAPAYRLKRYLRDGHCVIVEDGVGCSQPTGPHSRRRVCAEHLVKLRSAGVLHRLTDRLAAVPRRLERLSAADARPGRCALRVGGRPCPHPPRRRGLCLRCIHQIQTQGLDFAALANPSMHKKDLVLSRKPDAIGGVCAIVENGVACELVARDGTAGLCRRHYEKARVRGLLPELGLNAGELAGLSQLSHLYFHKSVAISFAAYEAFGARRDASSVELVTAVLQGRLRATISQESVRAVYSYVGHRLARPIELGGLGSDELAAERQAREYVGRVFHQRGGSWSLTAASAHTYRRCTTGVGRRLALEDALDIATFERARLSLGCTLLVIADRALLADVRRAVSPEDALARMSEYSSRHPNRT